MTKRWSGIGWVGSKLVPLRVALPYPMLSYARSADMACEQVAAIRTVASLNREPYILEEFEKSLEQSVHEAMMKTLKSIGVRALMMGNTDGSFMRLVWVISSFRWLLYFGMGVHYWRTASTLLLNSLSRMVLL